MKIDHIIVILIIVFFAIITIKLSEAATIEQCKLEKPYRCVPDYGNKIVCGCGL